MPSIDLNLLNSLKDDYKNYDCFIETGTFMGGTIFAMENYFKQLYTVELSPKYYNETKATYKGDCINFLLGDSSDIFVELLPTIKENAIFFLDGHWSSADTGKGKKDCPLIEEITTINNLFKGSAIVIIDDCRLFGKHPGSGYNEDWKDISKEAILNIIKGRMNNVYSLDSEYSKDDRLIIHVNPLV